MLSINQSRHSIFPSCNEQLCDRDLHFGSGNRQKTHKFPKSAEMTPRRRALPQMSPWLLCQHFAVVRRVNHMRTLSITCSLRVGSIQGKDQTPKTSRLPNCCAVGANAMNVSRNHLGTRGRDCPLIKSWVRQGYVAELNLSLKLTLMAAAAGVSFALFSVLRRWRHVVQRNSVQSR